MKPRTCLVAVYVALGLAATLHAQADCADWNTEAYFEAAEVSDVTRCLQAGMDLESRAEEGLTPLHKDVHIFGGRIDEVEKNMATKKDIDITNKNIQSQFAEQEKKIGKLLGKG